MSENLDLVRSIYADWERGDFGHAAEWADADIEYVLAGGGPADGSWRGLDGMAEGFRNYLSAWEDFRVQADEYRELDDGRVLVLTWYSGRGKTSGLNLGSTRGDAVSRPRARRDETRHVRHLRQRPRQPRPGGVGDVAGERGGGAPGG